MSESALGKANGVRSADDKEPPKDCDCRLVDLPSREYRDEEWLRHQYHHLEKSGKEIAKEFGYGSTTINGWIEKHDIEKRQVGDVISKSKTKNKKHHKKEWLQKKYHKEELTIVQIANEAGVSRNTIARAIHRNNIETRDGWEYNIRQGPWNDQDWLRQQYIKQNKSVPDISEEFGVSESAVYQRLKEYNIERRSSGTKGSVWQEHRKYTDEEWLKTKYFEEELHGTEIAMECGVSEDVVYYWMDEYEIKTREASERTKELAPNWNGGAAIDYGSNWKRMRAKTRERDNHTCQACGHEWKEGEIKLDVHHITPIKDFDTPEDANTLDNLVTLCRTCHNEWEGLYVQPDTR
jgi:transposase